LEIRQSFDDVLNLDEDILYTYFDVLKERNEQQRRSAGRRRR
jgi:hypothetical protein